MHYYEWSYNYCLLFLYTNYSVEFLYICKVNHFGQRSLKLKIVYITLFRNGIYKL